eukprot:TRINITY_DN19249_c0_g1_i1.p1 TRINITY_DN19249_c0_g1~~TRINITY_DN19249_c0_g1_i1.p1  ORF type:complete len:403 (+),score=94.86 TRINITY_DN19249_c0_g1_i1:71-1279(+)
MAPAAAGGEGPGLQRVEALATEDGVYWGTVAPHPRKDVDRILKHGRGRIERPNGDLYEGEFELDSMSGTGVLHSPNGDLYEGEFWGNLRHGIGVQTDASGATYSGQWQHDERHGKGDESLPDGTVYEGLFRGDARHGFGKLVLPNRVEMRGEFAEGLPHGARCVVTYPNGDVYEGAFKCGKRDGNGRYTVARTGVVHFERYEAGVCTAGALAVPPTVSLIFANGDTYRGDYCRGTAAGDAVADPSAAAADLSAMPWEEPLPCARDGVPHGKGAAVRDGRLYEGCFADGLPEGDGVVWYEPPPDPDAPPPDPDDPPQDPGPLRRLRYVGAFHEGIPTGWGTMHFSNGDRREGCWHREKAEGLQFLCRDGDTLEGAWDSAMWAGDQVSVPNRYPRGLSDPPVSP